MSQSVQTHPELRMSNLHWLRKLKLSAVLSLWMAPLAIASLFFVCLFPPEIMHFIFIITTTVLFVPAWLLSSPEPRTENQPPEPNIRKALRNWTVLSLGLKLASRLVDMIHPKTGEMMGFAVTVISIVYCFYWFYYLRTLALRIPDRKLAGFTSLNLWFSVIFILISLLSQIIAVSSKPPFEIAVCTTMPTSMPTRVLLEGIFLGTSFCLFCPVVLVLLYILTIRFYQAFSQAIQYQTNPRQEEKPSPNSTPPKNAAASNPVPPWQI